VLAFPEFLNDTMPLLVDMYLPAHLPLWAIGAGAGLRLVMPLLILSAFGLPRLREPQTALLVLAAAGFAVATIIQAKGWPYHYFPIVALTLLPLFRAVIEQEAQRPRGIAVGLPFVASLVAVGLVTVWGCTLLSARSYSAILIEAVRAVAPARPKILTISADIALGHPLTRELGGLWVDRLCSHWITANGDDLLAAEPDMAPQRRAAIEKWMAFDRAALVEDITTRRPDVILVEEGWWQRWSGKQGDVAAALSSYDEVKSVAGVAILLRRAPM